jgi:hypothetical protein
LKLQVMQRQLPLLSNDTLAQGGVDNFLVIYQDGAIAS